MGMAASQARLLTITARLADNELRSQTINNAKMRLAAQSSQASENYINALNNAVLKFTNYDEVGEVMNQALTFNALTAYSSYNTQYGLVNSAGQVLVSEAEDAIFKSCGNNLNNYLKAHGLEYKTTYFDEAGAFANVSYPNPFNHISPEELNNWYEEYDSYENSVEVENFQKAYSEYAKASSNLTKAGEQVLNMYLTNENANTITSTQNGYVMTLNSNTFAGLQNEFEGAFTNDSNKYNFQNLLNKGYISQELVDQLNEDINATSYESVKVYNSTTHMYENKVQGKLTEKLPYTTEETDTEIKYNFDTGFSITVNKTTGNVVACDTQELMKDAGDKLEITINNSNCKTDNTQSLKDFLSKFSYTEKNTDKNGNTTVSTYYHKEGDDGNFYSYTYYDDVYTFKNLLQETRTGYIMNKILKEFDFEKFLDDLSKDYTAFGIPASTRISGANNMTISEIIQKYKESKEEFLDSIFTGDSQTQVLQDLKDKKRVQMKDAEGNALYNRKGELDLRPIIPENLQDIEFIMQYLAQSENVNASTNFETVIKEYVMDQVIATNGTPKYAWVDENDITNSGNADAKAQWYTNLFTRMQQGYKALEDGLASSKEWIEYALKSGIVSMEQVNKSFKWTSMDYKTCTKITEETDDAAVTKAEAEYNRAMHDIEAKDNIYDLELKNIDTEHTSLQTEYDVIKEVIKKNIDRTMKFNQNA